MLNFSKFTSLIASNSVKLVSETPKYISNRRNITTSSLTRNKNILLNQSGRNFNTTMINTCKSLTTYSFLATKRLNIIHTNINGNPIQITRRHMNRNARRPKKANHGKRPCSHVRRRLKQKMIRTRRKRKPLFSYLQY